MSDTYLAFEVSAQAMQKGCRASLCLSVSIDDQPLLYSLTLQVFFQQLIWLAFSLSDEH